MRTHNADELRQYAASFVGTLQPTSDSATVIALSGELGAGKTTFAQGIARALGVEEAVTSPTYVIEKIYKLSGQKWERLVHVDAYRLKSAHELEVLGWKELLADAGNIIVLEWPERVAGAIPEDATCIAFEIVGEERILSIHGKESAE